MATRPTPRLALALAAGATFASLAADARADDLAYEVRAESSGYKDTDAVSVLTESAHASIEGVTTGWGVGAGVLVDVVTAASADIVATASPKWTDIRVAPTVDGHFRIDDVTLSLGGDASVESDYYAGSGSVGLSVDLAQKTITPAFTYGFGYNAAGRRQTPLSVYSLESQTHAFGANVTFVVDKATIIVPAFRATLELGDMEKPYRYLPTFAPGTVVGPGLSRQTVDALRTGVRVAESVPDVRHRYSLSALVAHRFGDATVRVEQRLYADSWWLVASTTDTTMPIDFGGSYRIWPHRRFHAQSGVSFWERAYTVEASPQGLILPKLRVGDPELGPQLAGTGGVGFRIGGDRVGLTATADAIYTRFLDHLYIRGRVGGLGSLVFDLELE
jgi:hypothetical protein